MDVFTIRINSTGSPSSFCPILGVDNECRQRRTTRHGKVMPGTLLSDGCIASEITRQLSYTLDEPPRPLVTFSTFWNSGIVTSSQINLHFPQSTFLRVPRRELQKKWNPRMTRIRQKKNHEISRVPFFRMRPIPAGMMYALTRLGSGKARCFSSKSSRSCVGSPKTKRPDGSSARQKRTVKMGTVRVAYIRWLIVPLIRHFCEIPRV